MKILSGRRAYEFRRDDIRLTMLTTQPVLQMVTELFQFQASQIGYPQPTFGSVPQTFPPGAVFNLGHLSIAGTDISPIRYLHIEPLRIVVDVAGPSELIDHVWAILVESLSAIQAPDGSPVIGEPRSVLDYSEIAFDADMDPMALIPVQFRSAFYTAVKGLDEPELSLAPSVFLRVQKLTDEYPGANVSDPRQFQLGLRTDSTVEQPTFFSAAPLNTRAHLAYLDDLLDKIV